MNLLAETNRVLKLNNKTLESIDWFGCRGEIVVGIELPEFLNVDYSEGFGGAEIAGDLILVGDGFWLERGEYDGSEWWEFKKHPDKPEVEKEYRKCKNNGYDSRLSDMNKPEEMQ